jgi:hypothetical protein
MYKLDMIVNYRNNSFDLEGSWNSDTSELIMQFAHKSLHEDLWDVRQQKLAAALGVEILAPTVELIQLEESESNHDIVAVQGLFVTLPADKLLSRFMINANLTAMAALRLPPPTGEIILDHIVRQTMVNSARSVKNICNPDLVIRQKPRSQSL